MNNQHDWSCAVLANRIGEEQFHLAALQWQGCARWWEVRAEPWGSLWSQAWGSPAGRVCWQLHLHPSLPQHPSPARQLQQGKHACVMHMNRAQAEGLSSAKPGAMGGWVAHVTSGGCDLLLCRVTGRWVAGLLTGCHQQAPCPVYWQPALLTPTHLLLLFNTWRISPNAVWQNIEYRRNNNFHLWRNTFGWD